jgi:hypothetical protein
MMRSQSEYLNHADAHPQMATVPVAWLKDSPPVVGINRPLKTPKQYSRSQPPCERAFDKIHSNGGN